ncbi:hypothetical protein ACFVTJ_04120 [Agrobacterium sp. NPDC058088]|uniref:hypothetical protein n=1 Tax=Agrobacterium sp. NPDC058088 TaxID=3346335 RepID=UPI0036DDA00F
MKFTASDIAAFYAAIVATGALFLEVRRWFESGVKIKVTSNHQYSAPDFKQHVITATATSIGDAPTTITGLEVWVYPTLIHSLLRVGLTRMAVLDTTTFATPESSVPSKISPGDTWAGGINEHVEAQIRQGLRVSYFAVRTTRYKRPFFARIRW